MSSEHVGNVLGAYTTVRQLNKDCHTKKDMDGKEQKSPLTKLPPGPPLVAAGADAGIEYIADGDGDGAGALVVALCGWEASAKQDSDLDDHHLSQRDGSKALLFPFFNTFPRPSSHKQVIPA